MIVGKRYVAHLHALKGTSNDQLLLFMGQALDKQVAEPTVRRGIWYALGAVLLLALLLIAWDAIRHMQ